MGILPYVAYCAWVEFRILKHSCINCYYYGKICCLGRSRFAALLFKKGDPQKFVEREISWKDILPDFLVSLIPIVAGIVLLISVCLKTTIFWKKNVIPIRQLAERNLFFTQILDLKISLRRLAIGVNLSLFQSAQADRERKVTQRFFSIFLNKI